ncbi:Coenzyme F420 hydrogenase/dehydrogenase, beta subunit C-terminal domain [uncultured Oscillibacter sp.]|uniref:Coenzyme F420 hydrogenase/dehydrogenase, beta subunit C-terminal domain n=1 Tax=uncultured Oscillibacter sp. TaxID=876091 RepID=UPI0025D27ECF|nr:Coenzyme F420 hydrogenase/dehydrogenase, beta subunit C-terminal domain [uncultured Oscillibacter sp.]
MLSTIALDTQVLRPGLCTGCGACQGLCPYWGSVDGRTVCFFDCERRDGRCQRFCPRMPTDLDALRRQSFPAETILPQIGPFRGLYLARAADESIRASAQHGGSMTALVELALVEGFIDAAVLTRSRGGLAPEGVLAATAEEVRSCSGSSFQVPPTLAVLNRALKEDRYHSIGVVGTPCKTLAVYKMKAYPLPEEEDRSGNIGMVFGLFCGWGLDWDGLNALTAAHADPAKVSHMDIPPSKYHSLELREEGETVSVDLDEVTPLVRSGCRYCADMTAEFADLSVGGARSADGWDVDKGWNQIIVRSEKGQRLLDLAREKGVLEFKEPMEGGLEKLQKAAMGKKRTAAANLRQLTGRPDDLGYLEPSRELFKDL